jgi:hypothetical protein
MVGIYGYDQDQLTPAVNFASGRLAMDDVVKVGGKQGYQWYGH